MENSKLVAKFSVKSGEDAKYIVEALVNAGFYVARLGCTKTETEYIIFKKLKK